MEISKKEYLIMLILHAILGLLVSGVREVIFLHLLIVFVLGTYIILKNKNKNHEALLISAYWVGMEVFIRMSKVDLPYETSKYLVLYFMILGSMISGIKKVAFIYLVFILLLIPSIYISIENLQLDTNIRKVIIFNLIGPITLSICSIYCVEKNITLNELKKVLSYFIYPIVSCIIYIILFTPTDFNEIITNTSSNSATSGGFGPNQVSTILGLGMFALFVSIILNKYGKIILLINITLLVLCTYRGVLTFSRGGVYVGLAMIILLVINLYKYTNTNARKKLIVVIGLGLFTGFILWGYTNIVTGGLIEKRYANEDALGREKESILSGREQIMESELQMFLDNPLLGVGVGRNKEIREELTGIEAASHNEITRMLAEHGSLGIAGLLLLIAVPLMLYFKNRENIFLLSFFIFWALTINHAAMRLAAPAFIYALSLLNVRFHEETPLHRE